MTTFLWFACREDFDCLMLSIGSVRAVCPDYPMRVVCDERALFTDIQKASIERTGCQILDMPFSGMWKTENVAKVIRVLASVDTEYVTKIDADTMLFGDCFLRYMQDGFMIIGTRRNNGGTCGAFISYRTDTIKWLATKTGDIEKLDAWLKTLTQPMIQEDVAIPVAIRTAFECDTIEEGHDPARGFLCVAGGGKDCTRLKKRFDAIHFGDRVLARRRAGIYQPDNKPRCADQIAEWMRDASRY